MRVTAFKNGKRVELPSGIDTIVIETTRGFMRLDLREQTQDMVLIHAEPKPAADPAIMQLVAYPVEARCLGVGVIEGRG